jgi:hypothetical protein
MRVATQIQKAEGKGTIAGSVTRWFKEFTTLGGITQVI